MSFRVRLVEDTTTNAPTTPGAHHCTASWPTTQILHLDTSYRFVSFAVMRLDTPQHDDPSLHTPAPLPPTLTLSRDTLYNVDGVRLPSCLVQYDAVCIPCRRQCVATPTHTTSPDDSTSPLRHGAPVSISRSSDRSSASCSLPRCNSPTGMCCTNRLLHQPRASTRLRSFP